MLCTIPSPSSCSNYSTKLNLLFSPPPSPSPSKLAKSKSINKMPTGISEEETQRIFKRFDTNGNDKISAAELGEALGNFGSTSPEEIKSTMAEIDTDGDGYISYSEFVAFCKANPGLMKDVAKVF